MGLSVVMTGVLISVIESIMKIIRRFQLSARN